MIPFENAYKIMMKNVIQIGSERVDLASSLDRVLAEDVKTDSDIPPFPKSAMDGYACRKEDLGGDLSVIEVIAAGALPEKTVGPGQCSKIMTGAPVPEGADCVIKIEDTRETGDNRVRFTGEKVPHNICARGEDLREGDVVLEKGEWITPAHIAVLATVGCANPLVSLRPRITVIPTGDELVDPTEKITPGKIRNSNGPQLCAQIKKAGAIANYFGVAGDQVEALDEAVKKAMPESDIVVLSGGVSMGDFDLVPGVLRSNGFKIEFEKVAMKPGKPTVFGRAGNTYCCGLPGNPVSTFVVFEIMLKPLIHKMMGHDLKTHLLPVVFDGDRIRGRKNRQVTVPVRFTEPGKVASIEYHGSAHISSITMAHAMLTVPSGVTEIRKGETVHVRPIQP